MNHIDNREVVVVDDEPDACPNCGDDRLNLNSHETRRDPSTGQQYEVVRVSCHNCQCQLQWNTFDPED